MIPDLKFLGEPVNCIKTFGDGREKHKVVVTDVDRTRILSIEKVRTNWPSRGFLRFESGQTYFKDSKTINGQKVLLFHYKNQERIDCQIEYQRTNDSLDNVYTTASPEDCNTALALVNERQGKPVTEYPAWWGEWARRELKDQLAFMSLVEMRECLGAFSWSLS